MERTVFGHADPIGGTEEQIAAAAVGGRFLGEIDQWRQYSDNGDGLSWRLKFSGPTANLPFFLQKIQEMAKEIVGENGWRRK